MSLCGQSYLAVVGVTPPRESCVVKDGHAKGLLSPLLQTCLVLVVQSHRGPLKLPALDTLAKDLRHSITRAGRKFNWIGFWHSSSS